MWKYIDIHSHLNFPEYDADREEVIARMKEQGIATITVGTSLETSRSAVELASKHDNVFASIGIHPVDAVSKLPMVTIGSEKMVTIGNFDTETELFDEQAFEELVKHPKVVAIGECGLDYGREGVLDDHAKSIQKALFEKQIRFAVKHDKPIMIHARNANADIIEMLRSLKPGCREKLRGNAHFFTGTPEEARSFAELDFSVSFTGVITFARDYDETVRSVSIEGLMSETDAPYVSPVPWRGRRNEPPYVVEVVKKIAQIKGLDEKVASEALVSNAVAKFGLV